MGNKILNWDEAPGGNSAAQVNVLSNTRDIFGLYVGQTLDTVTVLSDTSIGDTTIDIETTGTVPATGNFMFLQEEGKVTQQEIIGVTPVAGDQYTVTLDMPLDYAFTTSSTVVTQNVDMDVNGSVAPIEFKIEPKLELKFMLTRMMIGMVMITAGDDGLFGDITALSNGLTVTKGSDYQPFNLFNAKDNSDFGIEGYDVTYPTRSGGGGSYGMRSRLTFAGVSKRGAFIKLESSKNESFKVTVRDDLTGLNKFRIKLQGYNYKEA